MSAIVVKQIDFLPDKFRHAVRRRRASYWRVLVVVLFVAVFIAAVGGLQAVRRIVRHQFDQTNSRYTVAQAQEKLLKDREAKLAELRAHADLITFLRHPWPRSNLIEQLFAPLPNTVVIEKLHLGNELRPVPAAAASSEAATETNPARDASTDLVEIRKAVETNDVVIRLEGTTIDQPQLHLYLHQLAGGKMFRRADVESIEVAKTEAVAGGIVCEASRFTARIVVRAGWGLADGPSITELSKRTGAAPTDAESVGEQSTDERPETSEPVEGSESAAVEPAQSEPAQSEPAEGEATATKSAAVEVKLPELVPAGGEE